MCFFQRLESYCPFILVQENLAAAWGQITIHFWSAGCNPGCVEICMLSFKVVWIDNRILARRFLYIKDLDQVFYMNASTFEYVSSYFPIFSLCFWKHTHSVQSFVLSRYPLGNEITVFYLISCRLYESYFVSPKVNKYFNDGDKTHGCRSASTIRVLSNRL